MARSAADLLALQVSGSSGSLLGGVEGVEHHSCAISLSLSWKLQLAPCVSKRALLQGDIKRDSDGYSDEFKLQVACFCLAEWGCSATGLHNSPDYALCLSSLQYRHYQASLDVFNLKPSKESREFAELVTFVAQVRGCAVLAAEQHTGHALNDTLYIRNDQDMLLSAQEIKIF